MLPLLAYHRAAATDLRIRAARRRSAHHPKAYVSPTDRRLPLRSWRHLAIVAAVLLLAGCGMNAPRAVERPREGAAPLAGGTSVRLENVPPPTLAQASGLNPTPTSTPEPPTPIPPTPLSGPIVVSPIGSPGLAPIISGLQPSPGSSLPAGDIVISARISGTADILDVTAFVDGEAVPLDVGGGTPKIKSVSFIRTFISGTHEVRIQALDDRGQIGGYRWQFSIGVARQQAIPVTRPPTTTPVVPVVPVRTPIPIPTRRPTEAPFVPTPVPASAAPAAPAGPTTTRTPGR